MNKFLQIINVLACSGEFFKNNQNSKELKGVWWIKYKIEYLVGIILLFGILANGIIQGWVKIPIYLGDGYSYDDFSYKWLEGRTSKEI